jgi:hypothetical protein
MFAATSPLKTIAVIANPRTQWVDIACAVCGDCPIRAGARSA